MTPPHTHRHDGHRSDNRRRLALTMALAAVYMVAELVAGLLTNSLALLADAGHMLSDVAALGLSLFAIWIAQRPPTRRRTFGYYRVEILAALANGAALVAISILIFVEAWGRFAAPEPVDGAPMMAVAAGGLVVNLLGLAILHGGRSDSLNVRGAWLHVFTDALGSVQAIAAGALIWAFGWAWADPLASVLIGLLVIYSAWGLLKEAVAVLLEAVPEHIDIDAVRNAMVAVDGVTAVHDLHVWTITSGFVSLSTHLTVTPDCPEDVLWRVRDVLRQHFDITHSTIQVEHNPPPEPIRLPAQRP